MSEDTEPAPAVARHFVIPAVLAGAFLLVLVLVLTLTRPPNLDEAVMHWLQNRRKPALTAIFRTVTTIGSPVGVAVTTAVGLALLFIGFRARQDLLIGATALIGAELLGTMVKLIVARPRPPLSDRVPGVSAAGLSFPSGHSTQSAAAYLIIALLLGHRMERPIRRWLVYLAAVICVGLVGLSRLYLGVHWFTDVLASWLLGGACALTVWALAITLARRRAPLSKC